jgi:uncharacterized Zn-finger protein
LRLFENELFERLTSRCQGRSSGSLCGNTQEAASERVERDDLKLDRHRALDVWSRMIFLENRYPHIGSSPRACFSGSCSRNLPPWPLWCRPISTDMGMAETIVPHFHNDLGVPVIDIGAREFMCVGAMPPFDHPHVYCDMGGDNEFVCPYCSTLYRHDPSLAANAARPAECALHDAA